MISSKDNPTVKLASSLLSSVKARKKEKLFVAEGVRLCCDAAISDADIRAFLYTAEAAAKYPEEFELLSGRSARCLEISEGVFNKISDTATPQGFLCIISNERSQKLEKLKVGRKYAALETIQDPSNLGTILRTAEALGIDGVILSSGCCDIFSPKVVRGSMGAVFRLPFMITDDIVGLIRQSEKNGIKSYASTPRNAKDIRSIDFSDGGIILIGNEGNGLSEDTINACAERVMIKMLGRAESLNAASAAAILMYSMF